MSCNDPLAGFIERYPRLFVLTGKPVVAINLGRTRADTLLKFRLAQSCGRALSSLLEGDTMSAMVKPMSDGWQTSEPQAMPDKGIVTS
ncbi:MAG: hypothetical protein LBV45_09400 [Xanthomonadaceae bacterium]|nr:hypothetical protein [Xanthomonadaceae bacterium]